MKKASVSIQQYNAVRNMTTASCARHKHEPTREDSRGIWHETLKTLDQPTTKTQTLDPPLFQKGPLSRSQKGSLFGSGIRGTTKCGPTVGPHLVVPLPSGVKGGLCFFI